MTHDNHISELADRVERASGADRELDVLIGCAVRFAPNNPGCEWARADHWQYVPVPRISERIGCADKAGNVAAHWEAPAYTASLDAAMSLVPEGWAYGAGVDFLVAGPPAWAWVTNDEDYELVRAATPALALLAAALRALATGGSND